jgi:hypothetical protein
MQVFGAAWRLCRGKKTWRAVDHTQIEDGKRMSHPFPILLILLKLSVSLMEMQLKLLWHLTETYKNMHLKYKWKNKCGK